MPPATTAEAEIAFLHTSAVHIATFDALRDRLAPGLALRHEVREELLQPSQRAGCCAPNLISSTRAMVDALAEPPARVVVCTCSTLGPLVEAIGEAHDVAVIRIDRPMADEAVERGGQIAVCATLDTALHATCDLVHASASAANKAVSLTEHFFDGAWDAFEDDDLDTYYQTIAAGLRRVAVHADIILLAQASMEPAVKLCTNLGVPVLTSPESGFRAALARAGYRVAE